MALKNKWNIYKFCFNAYYFYNDVQENKILVQNSTLSEQDIQRITDFCNSLYSNRSFDILAWNQVDNVGLNPYNVYAWYNVNESWDSIKTTGLIGQQIPNSTSYELKYSEVITHYNVPARSWWDAGFLKCSIQAGKGLAWAMIEGYLGGDINS